MHQLWKLEGTRFPQLDSKVFPREMLALLANAPRRKVSK